MLAVYRRELRWPLNISLVHRLGKASSRVLSVSAQCSPGAPSSTLPYTCTGSVSIGRVEKPASCYLLLHALRDACLLSTRCRTARFWEAFVETGLIDFLGFEHHDQSIGKLGSFCRGPTSIRIRALLWFDSACICRMTVFFTDSESIFYYRRHKSLL